MRTLSHSGTHTNQNTHVHARICTDALTYARALAYKHTRRFICTHARILTHISLQSQLLYPPTSQTLLVLVSCWACVPLLLRSSVSCMHTNINKTMWVRTSIDTQNIIGYKHAPALATDYTHRLVLKDFHPHAQRH